MKKLITGHGGVVAYLGTHVMHLVEKEVINGNHEYRLIFEGIAYQVAKEIGACATTLAGKVDGICITGGLAASEMMVKWISDRGKWIAPIMVYPGEEEMKALVQGALRILRGEEEAREYI